MLKILVVEDEKPISNLICKTLREEGYHCDAAYDGKEGADLIERNVYDLALLDIMLPYINGYELLEYLLPTGTPAIFISAKGQVNDRIRGLKMGADDYLVKPFQVGELVARVETVLRRMGKSKKTLTAGDVEVNLDSRIVTKSGKQVDLTVKEYRLLIELIQNKNVALYRERLYEKVWDEEYMGETRTLDSHIQRLRKKLDWNDKIKTVFRIGYRLEI